MNRFIFSQHKSTGEVYFDLDLKYVLDAEGLYIPAFVLNGSPHIKVKFHCLTLLLAFQNGKWKLKLTAACNELGNFTSNQRWNHHFQYTFFFTKVLSTLNSTRQFIPWHFKVFGLQGISNIGFYKIAFLYDWNQQFTLRNAGTLTALTCHTELTAFEAIKSEENLLTELNKTKHLN